MSLSVTHVSKRFSSVLAVDDVTFTAKPGQALALLGGNGAGKTTTIRMILGLFAPDAGSIEWNGQPLDQRRVRIGYLPEERGLYQKSRVSHQLIYFGRLQGMSQSAARKETITWLERFGVRDALQRRVEELSKGNQQKIQLIATLMSDPQIVILDEPFSGLDPVNSDLLKGILMDLIASGKTVVFSSHQMDHVESFCEQICLLKRGRIILQGNLREIKRGYGRTSLLIKTDQDITALLAAQLGASVTRQANGYEIKLDSEERAQAILQTLVEERVPVVKFEIAEPSLHDIFIERMGE
ncbi:MAG: ABC transporter ATP-binding protein [Bacilli bacterium]